MNSSSFFIKKTQAIREEFDKKQKLDFKTFEFTLIGSLNPNL